MNFEDKLWKSSWLRVLRSFVNFEDKLWKSSWLQVLNIFINLFYSSTCHTSFSRTLAIHQILSHGPSIQWTDKFRFGPCEDGTAFIVFIIYAAKLSQERTLSSTKCMTGLSGHIWSNCSHKCCAWFYDFIHVYCTSRYRWMLSCVPDLCPACVHAYMYVVRWFLVSFPVPVTKGHLPQGDTCPVPVPSGVPLWRLLNLNKTSRCRDA